VTKPSESPASWLRERRSALLGDDRIRGADLAHAYAELIDGWLASLLPPEGGVALVAVGGYGRQELAPASDLDVLMLHEPARRGVAAAADQVWYPIWDAGLRLDHSVRTPTQAIRTAVSDLKVTLGLLDARLVAGEPRLFDRLRGDAVEGWTRRARRWLPELMAGVRARHDDVGPVAFVLEPDLKEGGGGLRDVTALRALIMLAGESAPAEVDAAAQVLFDARVELQRCTSRREDRLLLEHQDEVAAALGLGDADALMHGVAAAGRTVSWHLAGAAGRARPPLGRRAGARWWPAPKRRSELAPGVVRDGDELELAPSAEPAHDPGLLLRVAAVAAAHCVAIGRAALQRLAIEAPVLQGPWPAEVRNTLVEVLAAGPRAVEVFEALDQYGLVGRILPEWDAVRSRPQRNAFHRFTVDRHLVEAAAQAAALTERVDRPDLLLIGALLHDLGKGSAGDHTDAGVGLMRTLANRMGYVPDDVETLVGLVRHHLLLPAVATSRDLEDPATIAGVATVVGDIGFLNLLDALTEADSLATGPTAWNPWKEELVARLVERVRRSLNGTPHVPSSATPTADRALVARAVDGIRVEGTSHHLSVAAADQPRLFSRVVGLLALSGHDVRAARARPAGAFGISEFDLEPHLGTTPDWDRFERQLRDALEDELDVDAALLERAHAYGRLRRPQAARVAPPHVIVDNEASSEATVIEVHAADEVGVLFRIARALADLALDIRHAKVSTLGPEVIDTFYVVSFDGAKLSDPGDADELERRLVEAVSAGKACLAPR